MARVCAGAAGASEGWLCLVQRTVGRACSAWSAKGRGRKQDTWEARTQKANKNTQHRAFPCGPPP
eukprot:6749079-Prymnesium_polylepis.1